MSLPIDTVAAVTPGGATLASHAAKLSRFAFAGAPLREAVARAASPLLKNIRLGAVVEKALGATER